MNVLAQMGTLVDLANREGFKIARWKLPLRTIREIEFLLGRQFDMERGTVLLFDAPVIQRETRF